MKKNKKLIQCVWSLLVLVTGMQMPAWSEEVATQAGVGNGSFVPVISAENISNAQPDNTILPPPNFEDAPVLTLPGEVVIIEDEKKDPLVKDVLRELGLNEKETQTFLKYTEAALQSIEKALNSNVASPANYEAVEKQFERLTGFASKHSGNENVIKAVTAVISSFFEQVEKRTVSPADSFNDSVLPKNENLLQDLLDYESDEQNGTEMSANSSSNPGAEMVNSPERAKQREQVMEQVLEILRKGAVDSQSPAVSRAIYRSWYLSVSKRARDLRFSRLRAMMLRQQNAETPVPAI